MFTVDGPFARIIQHKVSVSVLKNEDSKVELDSNVDSPVIGENAYILEHTGKKVSVSGFTDALGKSLVVDVVHAAVAYDCDTSGKTYLVILHNALLVPSLQSCLINPFIMRLAGIQVDECPKFLAMVPSMAHHSLYFPDQEIRIPLALDGIVSYFPCRKPRGEEVSNPQIILHLTPQSDHWNPHDDTYQKQEESMLDFRGEVKDLPPRKFIVSTASCTTDPFMFAHDLESKVGPNPFGQFYVKSVRSVDGKDSLMDPLVLARKWNVGVDIARRTIQGTTRLCPRNTTKITLN